MNLHPAWQYDEMKQVGKDYGSLAEVEAYDARHGKFRNVEKENEEILGKLGIRSGHPAAVTCQSSVCPLHLICSSSVPVRLYPRLQEMAILHPVGCLTPDRRVCYMIY